MSLGNRLFGRSATGVRGGFTLVELLVVIGIIAVLISILLPTLGAARRQAQTASCLSSLRQWGSFFQFYANDNDGWWPMARHAYPPNASTPDVPGNRTREKRWHDFLGPYYNGGRLVNWDGSGLASPASNPNEPNSLGSVQDTVVSLASKNNVLRGCPSWDRRISYRVLAPPNYQLSTLQGDLFIGYSMNIYPFAPDPIRAPSGTTYPPPEGQYVNWIIRTNDGTGSSAANWGWYTKQSQWKRPHERALIYDAVHPNTSVTPAVPWWTAFGWDRMPPVPDIVSFTIDFNRHGRAPIGNRYTDKSVNVLFADGHAETVSCKEAHRAIRFTVTD
ncbi:MAG: type II secretion system protein [Tepidisphaerales bacterium]